VHPPTAPRESDDSDLDDGDAEEPPFSELLRDFIAFELKLFLDGLKDIVLAQGAVVAIVIAFFRRRRRGAPFYRLMHVGERFEHWLGLYRPIDDERGDAPFGGANRALREAERHIRRRRSRVEEEEEE
jgi:hypothetical protein